MTVILTLLIAATCAFSQPYEPTFLLDVTGEVGEGLGAGKLIALGDQDGDGMDDILTGVNHPNGGGALRVIYGTNVGQERFIQFGHVDTSDFNYYWYDSGFAHMAGDINGDSHADITMDLCRWELGDCYFRNTVFFGGPGVFDTIPDWMGNETEMQFTTNVGDYDGDGRDDVTRQILNPHGIHFYSSTDPLSSEPTWTHWNHEPMDYGDRHGRFGDFNGDGFSDFGIFYSTGVSSTRIDYFDLFLGSSEASSEPGYVYSYGPDPGRGNIYHQFIGDINGDSYDDIISIRSFIAGQVKWIYYGGEEIDFEPDFDITYPNPLWIPFGAVGIGDINGDGYGDIASYGDPESPVSPHNWIEIYLGGDPPSGIPAWELFGQLDGMDTAWRIGPAGDFNGDGLDDWMFSCFEWGERRGRIIVVAGDPNFGLPVDESPVFHPSSQWCLSFGWREVVKIK